VAAPSADVGVAADGAVLYAHNLGGQGPVLLICHAAGMCGRAYEPLAVHLRQAFDVWAIDFRGHGDSTEPANGDFSWQSMANDLVVTIDALGVAPVRVFGHSMGGALALLAEHTQSGTLHSAFVYEPAIIPAEVARYGDITKAYSTAARRRRDSFGSKAEAIARFATIEPFRALRADALASYVEHGLEELPDGSVRLKCRPEHEALCYEAERVSAENLAVDIPLVIARGDSNEGLPARVAPALVGSLGALRLISYNHIGHFGPLQDPGTVARDVIDILA
jgi:pimeloyl-ACP methyl ester carboxylesterase